MNAKTQRAWNNQLSGINDLLYWMYDTDVLNKGEKAKKDSVFRQYYRYYNDGDTPRGVLTKYKVSPFNKDAISKYLELYLEEFVIKILTKYAGKYDKSAFRTWKRNKALEDVAFKVEFGYESKSLSCLKNELLEKEIIAINERYTTFRRKLVELFPTQGSYTLSYIMDHGDHSDADLDEYAIIVSRQKRIAKKIRDLKED